MIMVDQAGPAIERWVRALDLELHDHVGDQYVTHRNLGWVPFLFGFLGT